MSDSVRSRQLEELLTSEVAQVVPSAIDRVIIPCGATEAHGAAGLGTDTIIPVGISNRIAEQLNALVAPAVPYGVLKSLRRYPGSVSLDPATYAQLLFEIGTGLLDSGFRKLIFINGHSGNFDGIKQACFRLHRERAAHALAYDWFREPVQGEGYPYGEMGGHSGAAETGLVLALRPGAAPEGRWKDEDAGTLNPAITAYPGPFPIILDNEGAGLPDYDPKKAEIFLESVTSLAASSLKRVLDRWEALGQ